jgi:hypothetical protein
VEGIDGGHRAWFHESWNMRPLQNNGPAPVFFSAVVDEEELKQTVLGNVAVLENGRTVQRGRHCGAASV